MDAHIDADRQTDRNNIHAHRHTHTPPVKPSGNFKRSSSMQQPALLQISQKSVT
jgi:hypothetical protein